MPRGRSCPESHISPSFYKKRSRKALCFPAVGYSNSTAVINSVVTINLEISKLTMRINKAHMRTAVLFHAGPPVPVASLW